MPQNRHHSVTTKPLVLCPPSARHSLALAIWLVCLPHARAANECGTATAGASIICDPATYVASDGRIVYSNLNGLSLTASGLGLVAPALNNRHGIFVSTGSGASGTASTGTVHIRLDSGFIVTGDPLNVGSAISNTAGRYGDGIRSENYGTGDTVASVGADVTTYGYNASGAYAWHRQPQALGPVHVQADMDRGAVLTHGAFSHGLYARSESGQGSTAVILLDGEVRTLGNNANGLFANSFDTLPGGAGSVRVESNDARVETSGHAASAIVARNRLAGNTSVEAGNTVLATSGDRSVGIVAESFAGHASVRLHGGSLITLGSEAHGIQVNASGGDATVVTSADIRIAATDAVGILATASGDIVINHNGTIDSGGSAVVAVAGGRVTLDNRGHVTSQSGHAIDVSAAAQGAVIENRGTIRANAPGHHAIVGSPSSDVVRLLGGTVRGSIDLGGGDDLLVASGSTLQGSVDMGSGDDSLLLRGSVQLSGVPRLDGGGGNDRLVIDGMSLRGFTGQTDRTNQGINLLNWQAIDITRGGTLKLVGNLLQPAAEAQLRVGAGAALDLTGNSPGRFTIHGTVSSSGVITLYDGSPDDRTVIAGHYRGRPGSVIVLDAQFDGDASASDQLVIQGDVNGRSTLVIEPTGGFGAQTVRGILLIQVDGRSGPGSFVWDIGTLQVGNYQYVLKQGSAEDANDWYLVSHVALPQNGATSPLSDAGMPLWRPAIAGYSVARSLNADTAFLQTATLHQREGERTWRDGEDNDRHAWGRWLGQTQRATGRYRFSYRNRGGGFQLGADLDVRNEVQGERRHVGFLAHYTEDLTRAWDHLRREAGFDTDTGQVRARSLGAGAYRTQRLAHGGYTDWVIHLNHIDNRYSDITGEPARQTGWQWVISRELGGPWWQADRWSIDWQTQWTLAHTRYSAFEDGFSRLPAQSFNALRGRLGLRVHTLNTDGNQANAGLRFHGTAHLVHDLFKTRGMWLEGHGSPQLDRAMESFDQTYLELGAGIQVPLPAGSWLWTDARYERGMRNRKNTGRLSMGVAARF